MTFSYRDHRLAARPGGVHRVLAGLRGPERLHPVYALDGSSPGAEAVIDTLPGYAGSRPVRIGNIADQRSSSMSSARSWS